MPDDWLRCAAAVQEATPPVFSRLIELLNSLYCSVADMMETLGHSLRERYRNNPGNPPKGALAATCERDFNKVPVEEWTYQ